MEAVGGALAEFFGDATPCAQTMMGVQALALPQLLVEFDAVAIVD